jgi:ABC-2 type transport system permease protein
MTTAAAAPGRTAAPLPPGAPSGRSPRPEVAIARRAFRHLWLTAAVVGVVFGGSAASSALSYVSTFPTEASRQQLTVLFTGENGFTMLFGQVSGIGSVGGYTVYKTYVFLTTIGAIWAALATTRLLRGEEDAGRWQLIIAGGTTAARATVATLVPLAAAVGVVFVATTSITVLTGASGDVGFSATDSILFGLSVSAAPAVFVAVAVVCSQLAQTRRVATGLTMAVFAVAFVVRMLGDASPEAEWVLWLTPLGWMEQMKPFTGNNPWPLLPIAAFITVTTVAGVVLSGRRDAGDGLVASRASARLRPHGLGTPLGLAARLSVPVLAAWLVGVVAVGFIMGTVAKSISGALAENSAATSTLDDLGAGGNGPLQYLGIVFLMIGAMLALVPASQVGAARDEEASGRLALVMAGPPSRTGWLTGRLALSAAAVIAMGLVSGLAAWAGARIQGVEVAPGPVLAAGINIVPAALLVLALGMLVLAAAPRLATAAVYALVAWSFIIDLLASLVENIGWMARLSIFHYVSLAPADDPDWTALAVITGLAVALAAVAVAIFGQRDLAPD